MGTFDEWIESDFKSSRILKLFQKSYLIVSLGKFERNKVRMTGKDIERRAFLREMLKLSERLQEDGGV